MLKKLTILNKRMLFRYADLETLLLDVRDGTKNYYKEKRGFARIKGSMTAKIVGNEDSKDLIQVLNGSRTGALLRMQRRVTKGEVLNLWLYLPLYPQPIEVKTKVIRITPNNEKSDSYDVGVEIIGLNRSDREKFLDTIAALSKERKE